MCSVVSASGLFGMSSDPEIKLGQAKDAFEQKWKKNAFRCKVFRSKHNSTGCPKPTTIYEQIRWAEMSPNCNPNQKYPFVGSPMLYCSNTMDVDDSGMYPEYCVAEETEEAVESMGVVEAGEYVNEHMEYWLQQHDIESCGDQSNNDNHLRDDRVDKKVIPAIHVSEQGTVGIHLFSDMLIEIAPKGCIRVCQINHMAATCMEGRVAIQHPNAQIESEDGGHMYVNMCQGPTARTLSGVVKVRACAKPYLTPSSHQIATAYYESDRRGTGLPVRKYITNMQETTWNMNAENGLWEEEIVEDEWSWPERDMDLSQDLFTQNYVCEEPWLQQQLCADIFNGVASYIVDDSLNVQVPLQNKYIQIEQNMKTGAVKVRGESVGKIILQPQVQSIDVTTTDTHILVQSWARVTATQASVQLHLDQGLDGIHIWHGPLVCTFDLWGKAIPPCIQNVLSRLPPWINHGQDTSLNH